MACSCSCHTTGAMHVAPCCYPCPKCKELTGMLSSCKCTETEEEESDE